MLVIHTACEAPAVQFFSFFLSQQHGLFKAKPNKKHPFSLGLAERKILIILCYCLVVASFSLTSYTVNIRDLESFDVQLKKYFRCESAGHDASNPCDRHEFEQFSTPSVTAVIFILLGFFPLFNLIYAVNFGELKKFISKITP